MKPILSMMVVLVALASCAAPDPQPAQRIQILTRDRVERFIVKGKTTKSEVIAEFGLPSAEVVMNNDLPGSPYETLSFSKRYTLEVAILTVSLNRQGIVTGYTFTGTGPMTNFSLPR